MERAEIVVPIMATFITSSAEQIRLAPDKFVSICNRLKDQVLLLNAPIRGVAPLLSAVRKLLLSSERLTALHPEFLQLCLLSKCYKAGFSILEDDIFEVDQPRDLYLFCYYGGMICIGLKRFQKALDLLHNVCYLTRAHLYAYLSNNTMTTELIFTSLPKYTSNVAMRTLKNFCQDNPSHKYINRGTLVVFNLDPSVSNEELRQIFGAYGEVKEVTLIIVNQWLSYRTTRESTPCNLIKDVNNIGTPCSTTKQTSPASNYRRAHDGVQRSIPTSLEMDAFFSSMERENQRLFIEKYVSGVASDSHWSVSNSDGNGKLVLYRFGSVSQGTNYRDHPGVIFGSDDEAILVLFLIMLRSPRCEGSIASTHKIWRVREEFARIVAYAVTLFASIKLPLQCSILPPVF
ncbi:hypothetical protein ACFE04_010837 [Oxalis oulophora]